MHEREERYKDLADSITDIFFAMDSDLKYTYWNKAAEMLTGISVKDAIGKSLYELFPEVKGTRADKAFNEVLRAHKAQSFENEYQLRDKKFIFEIYVYSSSDGLSVLAKDITRQRQVENKLKESEEKFRILSEQFLLGITIIQDDLVKYINDTCCKIIEFSKEEILNWKVYELLKLVYPDDQSLVAEQHQKLLVSDEKVDNFIFRIVAKSGKVKWIEIYPKTVQYNGRKAYLLTLIDITKQKRSEKNNKIQQQRLVQADKLASLGVLVAGVAHEINNPNHTILANADLITEAWKSIVPILEEYYEGNGDFVLGGLNYTEMREEMPKYLKGISDGAKRIDSIVSDLKNFSRQEEYDIAEYVNMNHVVKSAITLTSHFIVRATRNCNIKFAENLPRIRGNFQRLEQVIINLIQNACQALRNRKESIYITTSYNKDKQCIEINVRDEGMGIPPEDILKVKDPFFTTKRDSGGTGLGLSISSAIIDDHKGTLKFTSSPGEGTTATVTLPVVNITSTN